jgi:pimeloyl-ACP methyl ester carboxylesterase
MCMVIVTSTGGCVISIVTTGLHGARLSWLCVRFYRWRRQCIILHSDILILHVQRSDYKERISWLCSLFFNEMYVMTSGKLDYIWRRPMLAKRRFPAWFLKLRKYKDWSPRKYGRYSALKNGYPLEIIRGAAHNSNVEKPQEVNDCIRRFLLKALW